MSIALSKNGVDISGSNRFRKIHTEGGIVHQPSAQALADWLSLPSQLGTPQKFVHSSGEWSFNDFSSK